MRISNAKAELTELQATFHALQLKYERDTQNLHRNSLNVIQQANRLESQVAQLEHVAYNALAELERMGALDFLLIKDATCLGYWQREKNRDK